MGRGTRGLLAGALGAMLAWATPSLGDDRIVRVGAQNLQVRMLGEAGPAIVFEAGLGEDLSTWDQVAPPIAKFGRVVLYDRAGLGGSLPLADATSPITADRVVRDLSALLDAVGVEPFYVLVGHSLGGLYAQLFARLRPDAVSGVVLIDAASPDAPSDLKTLATLEPGTASYLEEAGVAASNRQIAEAGPFPAVPLVVIAATDHGPHFREWEPTLMRLQQGLAGLSPLGELVVAEGSGHDVQHDRPELVIEAVRRVAEP